MIKWIFGAVLLLPGIYWLYLAIDFEYSAAKLTTEVVQPTSKLGWANASGPITVKIIQELQPANESKTFQISLISSTGKEILSRNLSVSLDMWGGGFVAAMEVDDDDQSELVVWGTSGRSFYLDKQGTNIVTQPWSKVSNAIKAQAIEYQNIKTTRVIFGISFIMLAIFYIFVSAVWIIIALSRRRMKTQQG